MIKRYCLFRATNHKLHFSCKVICPRSATHASHKTWLRLSDGIEVAERPYQSPFWDKPRRMVMLRQHVPTRPKATGRSLKLFQDEGIYKQYRIQLFITNLDLPCEQIWTLYRQRADAENRIKELKYDFGSDSFNQQSSYATEAALNFVMMAYNFISLFRQVCIRTEGPSANENTLL